MSGKIDGSKLSEDELIDKVKAYLNTQFEYLKSCEDFGTTEAYSAIDGIDDVCYYMESDEYYKKICGRIVAFMLQQGLAQLLIKVLKSLIDRTDNPAFDSRLGMQVVIGRLAVNIHHQTAKNKVRVDLVKCGAIHAFLKDLESCDPNTTDPRQRVRITQDLLRLGLFIDTPELIPIYRAANAVNILVKFAEAEDVMTEIDTLHVLARIVNEKESKTYLGNSAGCIKTMIEMLNKVAQSENEKYSFVIKVDGKENKFDTHAGLLAQTIGYMLSNEATKEAIVGSKGISALSAILRPNYSNLSTIFAAEALWKLAFDESYLDAILTHLTVTDQTAMQVLKDMQSSADAKCRDASQGLLNRLGMRAIHEETPVEQPSKQAHPRDPPPFYTETMTTNHVMISYKWEHQEKAKKLRDKLQAQGYNVWLDIDKLEGNILEAITNAVDKADAILIFISRSYKTSPYCRTEAYYAYDQEKLIIPIIVEKDYKGDGWLRALIALKKYIRAYSDEVLDQDMPHLIRELKNRGRKL